MTRESIEHEATAQFSAAIAAYLQPSLVQLQERAAVQGKAAAPVTDVEIGVRVSPRGTVLVGVFNRSAQAHELTLSTQAVADTVIDMQLDRALVARVRGLRVETDFSLPAHGWKLLAFPKNRQDYDDERNTPRLKARLR